MSVSPMPGQWMMNVNGMQSGPFDDAVFRMMYAQGQVPLNAMVWQVGMQNWMPVTQVLGAPPRPTGMPPQMGAFPPQQMGYPPQQTAYPANQIGAFPQQPLAMQSPSGSSASKSRALAAIIGFFFPGLHRVYLGKGAGVGAVIFAVIMIVSGIPLLFGPFGIACFCGMVLVFSAGAIIDALTVQLDP